MSIWREIFAPLIAQVIADNEGASRKQLKRALKAAAPANVKEGTAEHLAWAKEVLKQTNGRIVFLYAGGDVYGYPPSEPWKSKAWSDPVPPGRMLDSLEGVEIANKPKVKTAGGG